jgi:hypothetical protein
MLHLSFLCCCCLPLLHLTISVIPWYCYRMNYLKILPHLGLTSTIYSYYKLYFQQLLSSFCCASIDTSKPPISTQLVKVLSPPRIMLGCQLALPIHAQYMLNKPPSSFIHLAHFCVQWITKWWVPDASSVTGGFEPLFVPSPFQGEEDRPMPCGWKVVGEHMNGRACIACQTVALLMVCGVVTATVLHVREAQAFGKMRAFLGAHSVQYINSLQ